MTDIPRENSFDSTLALLSEGYPFIQKRCLRHESDLFETRMMLRKVVCMTGAEAAQIFYHPGRFTRKRAMPPTTLMLLQDKGSVALLDREAHLHRKQMFMSVLGPAHIQKLVANFTSGWRMRIEQWEDRDEVVLHHEVQAILCRAVCTWAGVPLTRPEERQRTREFAAMIDGAGAVGPRNWRGLLLRMRTERWMRGIIEQIRSGEIEVPTDTAAHAVAYHRDGEGHLLDVEVAAVELVNVLRPTVAVARYVTFAALALHEHPEHLQQLQQADEGDLEAFVHEIRRLYPFFPSVGGLVREPFDWRGHHFEQGAWVLLDLYGTNHDARIWDEPHTFRPERFRHWNGDAFTFIPQGGGDHHHNHRCAGEWITIALMKAAVRMLTDSMQYDVPEQNLSVDLSRMPAIPESRFVLTNVRRR